MEIIITFATAVVNGSNHFADILVLSVNDLSYTAGGEKPNFAICGRPKVRVDGLDQWLPIEVTVPRKNAEAYFSEIIQKNPADADAFMRPGLSQVPRSNR